MSFFSIFSLMQLEFGSLLSYSPYGSSEEEKKSKSAMTELKQDLMIRNLDIPMSQYVSDKILAEIAQLPFAYFFKDNPILVPVPGSGLMKAGSLWVPDRLAKALYKNGLGKGVTRYLERKYAVTKSATCSPKMWPKAEEHYKSFAVHKLIVNPKEILLVDDIVTRGATLLGGANKLKDAFPDVRIRAFAAMRTTSSEPTPFKQIDDPKRGDITFDGLDTTRRP